MKRKRVPKKGLICRLTGHKWIHDPILGQKSKEDPQQYIFRRIKCLKCGDMDYLEVIPFTYYDFEKSIAEDGKEVA